MTIPAALARRREYAGPAIFSYGFRPFFLSGAVWAALVIALWIPQYVGSFMLPSKLNPLYWHIHEMLFGYVAAVVAGFLLTAIPNWTGRLPIYGTPLAGLAAVWLAGRIAMLSTAWIGLPAAAVIDSAFLVVLLAVTLREIVAGKNWRNLRVLGIIAVLILANAVFHVETILYGTLDYGERLGFAAVIMLISLVGGRIIPSFTRNWLVRANPGRLPQPFGPFDGVTLAVSALAFLAWVVAPHWAGSGILLVVAGLLHAGRLARWAGDRTFADRLVLVLHVAYAFVPLGFLLTGAGVLWPLSVPESAGLHAFGGGAIGMMTLAVMTRASLGHTGQSLVATPATQAIYACVAVGAIARILAAFTGGMGLMHFSATAWVLGFAGFAVVYGPALLGRPPIWAR
jgi:uncharacterized protein involved in response to NO